MAVALFNGRDAMKKKPSDGTGGIWAKHAKIKEGVMLKFVFLNDVEASDEDDVILQYMEFPWVANSGQLPKGEGDEDMLKDKGIDIGQPAKFQFCTNIFIINALG